MDFVSFEISRNIGGRKFVFNFLSFAKFVEEKWKITETIKKLY